MTELSVAVEDYLSVRRALGFKLRKTGHRLSDFVAYVERAGASTISTELAMAWAQQPLDGDPSYWAERLSAVRLFACHLQTLDPETEVPPVGPWSHRSRRAVPYLYSVADVARLMDAARSISMPLRAATYETLIGLLAVTGMRVGEAIRLDRDDIDYSTGTLVVRDTKFGKSREVPLHPTTVSALSAYNRIRDQLCPRPATSAVFASTAGTRLLHRVVGREFGRLARRACLERRSKLCRPRHHDLRHTFAVNTLIGWYRTTDDVAVLLPLLSTYLGHVNPGSTYWYLSAAPELLALAAQRLERAEQ